MARELIRGRDTHSDAPRARRKVARPRNAPDLEHRVFATLDARLEAGVAAPLCVGVSGGGDSVALLALACDWAAARQRGVLALSVDHALQPESAAWSRFAVQTAQALGAWGRVLRWDGDKPTSGLSAAARVARHGLLADAARAAGARVVLLAHTVDDIDEAAVMRAEGSTLGEVREWGPSPVWPQGRGVFLLRPLLGVRREALRGYLLSRNLEWIEDPANADLKYARARARASLRGAMIAPHANGRGGADDKAGPHVPGSPSAAGDGQRPGDTHAPPDRSARADEAVRGDHFPAREIDWRGVDGAIRVTRASLRSAAPGAARRFLSAALLCASGTTRPPRGAQLDALLSRLTSPEPVQSTLAGARITASSAEILIAREMPRGGLSPLPLAPESVSVWDGRFEIAVKQQGFYVVPAAGRMARLSARDRKQLQGLQPALRGCQPLLIGLDTNESELRPVLAGQVASVRPLAADRLTAALGGVDHERDIASGLVAPEQRSSYVG
jgi:tRNA(Ile)-lysidine synthase